MLESLLAGVVSSKGKVTREGKDLLYQQSAAVAAELQRAAASRPRTAASRASLQTYARKLLHLTDELLGGDEPR